MSLPVIFITANDSEIVCKDALESGCYLRKPFKSRPTLENQLL